MGIDVFGVLQRREASKWVFVDRTYFGTRGALNAWFGWDVRGSHPGVVPIVSLRGLPNDFDRLELVRPKDRHEGPIEVFLGESHHSWLLASEILSAATAAAAVLDDDGCLAEFLEFSNLVRQLADQHNEVRFVYGFALPREH